MEGYIHSFESFGTSDGPGIRFVVFLQGCPMRCLYCHNPDTREFTDGGKRLGTVYAPRQVLDEILKYEKYIASGGVTASGGEPMAQAEFVTELFSLLKGLGISALSDPKLTGEWEYKLAQIEKGRLSRDDFMKEIRGMTTDIVEAAKRYEGDTVPVEHPAHLRHRCPKCSGRVVQNQKSVV